MTPRSVKPLEQKVLSTLTAARLLAYRNRLLSLEDSPEDSDWEPHVIEQLDSGRIWFKSDARWSELYDQVLDRLRRQENVK